MLDINKINAYLYYGYLPNTNIEIPWNKNVLSKNDYLKNLNKHDLLNQGVISLKRSFNKACLNNKAPHIIPLSGGLDSRAILGGLLENFNKKEISAITFGTPGTFDFEIGQQVAKKAGIDLYIMDLSPTKFKWQTTDLISLAQKKENAISIFDSYINSKITNIFGNNVTYWSGFMGEALSGAHLPQEESSTWEEAQKYFIQWNTSSQKIKSKLNNFNPSKFLPDKPIISQHILSYDDQLDFFIRQQNLIKFIVTNSHSSTYVTPFLEDTWLEYILNISRKYRQNQTLYKNILQKAYPDIFSLPTKTHYGLPLNAPNWKIKINKAKLAGHYITYKTLPFFYSKTLPFINYIDFKKTIRYQNDFKKVIHENIYDLKSRNILNTINIDYLWNSHQKKYRDNSNLLLLLASLEINIKAGKFK